MSNKRIIRFVLLVVFCITCAGCDNLDQKTAYAPTTTPVNLITVTQATKPPATATYVPTRTIVPSATSTPVPTATFTAVPTATPTLQKYDVNMGTALQIMADEFGWTLVVAPCSYTVPEQQVHYLVDGTSTCVWGVKSFPDTVIQESNYLLIQVIERHYCKEKPAFCDYRNLLVISDEKYPEDFYINNFADGDVFNNIPSSTAPTHALFGLCGVTLAYGVDEVCPGVVQMVPLSDDQWVWIKERFTGIPSLSYYKTTY
jgi:hypothetical protein